MKLPVERDWQLVETCSGKSNFFGYRFYPDKVKGEGFFIAAIRKEEGEEDLHRSKKATLNLPSKKEISFVKEWIRDEVNNTIIKHGEDLIAIPVSFAAELPILQKNLYLKQAGISIGKLTSKDLVPDHALAMSNLGSRELQVLR